MYPENITKDSTNFLSTDQVIIVAGERTAYVVASARLLCLMLKIIRELKRLLKKKKTLNRN